GQPLKGVSIELTANLQGRPWMQSAASGVDGTFAFQGLAPGVYALDAKKAGYRADRTLEPLKLEPNQNRSGIDIKLNRAAAVTGGVPYREGAPGTGARLPAYRTLWRMGHRLTAPVESATADDRGIYRLHGLPAGRYLVGASAQAAETPKGELALA